MKTSMSRWIALALALTMALSAVAMASERTSDPFQIPGTMLQPERSTKPEISVKPGEFVEPQISADPGAPAASEIPTAPEASPEPEETLAPRHTVKLHSGRLNVRAAASTGAEILAILFSGDEVELLGDGGDWFKVRLADGTVGFVYSEYLTTGEPEPIPTEAEAAEPAKGAEEPCECARAEDGSLILDEVGNPIPVQFVAGEAEKIGTGEDEAVPERKIDIYLNWAEPGEQHSFGDRAVLTAVLTGYDGLTCEYQWQNGKDEASYVDVEGATDATYTFPVTQENLNDYWRVKVTITGAIE